ncbi:calcium-binding protein [Histidinibacterium lentulum]|uniref:Calcium-binding protein n=1 Tax=Histidinibacterium lentulum TaxID=2480588 RepID=A0A3N2R6L6_9RHOB|nr:calcium-binding protein [Histidinibacterium lentulum]ROU02976.1 hypothetical protein EAT49_06665 [Histidinibacterium lentulum]
MPATPVPWIEPIRLNPNLGGDQENPELTQLTNGMVVALWEDTARGGPAKPPGRDIVGQLYDVAGNKVGRPFIANGTTANNERGFDVAALPNGGFVVVYLDEPGQPTERLIRATEWQTDASGVTSSTNRMIASTPRPGDVVNHVSVDGFGDGSYLVAYSHRDTRDANPFEIRTKVVSADGKVSFANFADTGSRQATTATDTALLSNGNMVVAYDYTGSNGDREIAFRIVTPGNDNVGPSRTIVAANTSNIGDVDRDATVVALAGGGFVVAWTEVDTDSDILFVRYNNAGTPLGRVQFVNAAGVDNHDEPHLIALADGGFVIVYNDQADRTVVFQRYDASGNKIGREVTIAENVREDSTDPGGIGLADGRFIAAYETSATGNEDSWAHFLDPRDRPNDPGVYAPTPVIVGTIGDDRIKGTGLSEKIYGHFGNDTIDGGRGFDFIDGGPGFDFILGRGGNDTILGGAGFDAISGNAGNDSIQGNAGNDTIDGGIGNDTIDGGIGADVIMGKGGNDTIFGSDGFDVLSGNNGNDLIKGNAGNDLIFGGLGNDRLDGGIGADTLFGGSGSDRLFGKAGFDALNGGNGNDTLYGNAGNDTLNGGAGNDLLYGGLGADTFAFFKGNGRDTIMDMQEVDTILLEATAFGITSAQQLNNRTTETASAYVLDFGGGDVLKILKTPGFNLDIGDFNFI